MAVLKILSEPRTVVSGALSTGQGQSTSYTEVSSEVSSMDKNQILVLALANVPTIITVLIGILLNNGRLNDLNSRFSGMETRFSGMEHKFDTRFDLLLSKVIDLDNRLTRIEAQRH